MNKQQQELDKKLDELMKGLNAAKCEYEIAKNKYDVDHKRFMSYVEYFNAQIDAMAMDCEDQE